MPLTIDATGMHYRDLNSAVKKLMSSEDGTIKLENVNGQRYIADGLQDDRQIIINGVPGNDLAVFMDGPRLLVHGNIQDAAANTMNSGHIIVHGSAGDALGYGMRGGELYIREEVGYRAGIHIKEYGSQKPVIIIGGVSGDFLGEYMAGGIIAVLNLHNQEKTVGDYCARGMHGGIIYIRGRQEDYYFEGVNTSALEAADWELLNKYINNFKSYFNVDQEIYADEFFKVFPGHLRPFKKLYVGI